jgi:hypothetical protein
MESKRKYIAPAHASLCRPSALATPPEPAWKALDPRASPADQEPAEDTAAEGAKPPPMEHTDVVGEEVCAEEELAVGARGVEL